MEQGAGRQVLTNRLEGEHFWWEHWEPEERWLVQEARSARSCSSAALKGQPVRNRRYPRGFPTLPWRLKGAVAESNAMADWAIRRLERRLQRKGFAVLAHPRRSWLWQFPSARGLRHRAGVYFTELDLQEEATRQERAIALLHNNPALHRRFDGAKGAQVPASFHAAYADVVAHSFQEMRQELLSTRPWRGAPVAAAAAQASHPPACPGARGEGGIA